MTAAQLEHHRKHARDFMRYHRVANRDAVNARKRDKYWNDEKYRELERARRREHYRKDPRRVKRNHNITLIVEAMLEDTRT